MLANFARKRGITYPLLSDQGSTFIRALGLLNQHIEQQNAYYGVTVRDEHHGIPYPGAFVLDENGLITEKWFEQSYRVRPTAASLLEQSFGTQSNRPKAAAEAGTEHVRLRVDLGTASYHPYQRLLLRLTATISDGLHVYGEPALPGFTALSVEVEPVESLIVGELSLPAPESRYDQLLGEEFRIYRGTVRGTLPLRLEQNVGDVTLAVQVRYQACSDRVCYPASTVRLELPLTFEDNIRD